MLAVVALTEDIPERGLTRGELGTVVEYLGTESDPAYLVEFSDEAGEAYEFGTLRAEQLMVVHGRSAQLAS